VAEKDSLRPEAGSIVIMPVKRASGKPKSRRVFGHPGKRPKTALRAGVYARVSTTDQQALPMQLHALREYAARRGWSVTSQVKEVGCGAAQRQMREKLIDAARRREIDVVLVWRLDRWGRSVADLLATLQELDHLGVGFVSLRSSRSDDACGPCDGRATGRLRRLRARNPP
jgi:predicted site-specific integrase-resolvase